MNDDIRLIDEYAIELREISQWREVFATERIPNWAQVRAQHVEAELEEITGRIQELLETQRELTRVEELHSASFDEFREAKSEELREAARAVSDDLDARSKMLTEKRDRLAEHYKDDVAKVAFWRPLLLWFTQQQKPSH